MSDTSKNTGVKGSITATVYQEKKKVDQHLMSKTLLESTHFVCNCWCSDKFKRI